jgi:hypothetical protein
MRWSSVLGKHPLAPFFPAGNFGHYIRRNQIGYAAKSDFGSGFTGSFTDGFSKRFYGAVTRVKRNENVCLRGWHQQLLIEHFLCQNRIKQNEIEPF